MAITVAPEDRNGDELEVTFAVPSHGTLAGTGASVTYTPKANFAGGDIFQVTVSDGQATAMATIKVTVQQVNDRPSAANDTAATDEDVTLTLAASTLLANDTDADGQTLTISAVQNPSNGGDGGLDEADACPTQKEVQRFTGVLTGIQFAANSDTLQSKPYKLDEAVMVLSQRRADAVASSPSLRQAAGSLTRPRRSLAAWG